MNMCDKNSAAYEECKTIA